jgi:hypothetical protein
MPQNIKVLDKPTLDGDKHFRESLARTKRLEELCPVPWQKHEVGSAIAFLDSLQDNAGDTPALRRRRYLKDHDDILERLKEVVDEGQEGYYAGADNVWQHTGQDSHDERHTRIETIGDENDAE